MNTIYNSEPTGTVYEFALPKFANSGESYQWALQAWSRDAMRLAGGVTVFPEAQGAWRDPADGKVYLDKMIPHRVLCTAETAQALLEIAFRLFADQKAIFVTKVGEGFIVNRSEDET